MSGCGAMASSKIGPDPIPVSSIRALQRRLDAAPVAGRPDTSGNTKLETSRGGPAAAPQLPPGPGRRRKQVPARGCSKGDGAAAGCRSVRFVVMFDLGAYLDRIELRGSPTLAEVHRAHATSIPFENLGPWSGQPVSLDQGDIERKLVGNVRVDTALSRICCSRPDCSSSGSRWTCCWREPGLGDGQVRFVRARI